MRARPGILGLALAILLGITARTVVMIPRIGGAADDPDNYLPLARSLASGEGFTIAGRASAYRPPLYPILLTPLVGRDGDRFSSGIAGLHLVLGAATITLTFLTARRWGLSSLRASTAALIVALDPVLVAQSRAVMTETLAAALLAFTLWCCTRSSRRGAVLTGFAFGLAGLCRPSTLPIALVWSGFDLMRGPGPRSERITRSVLLGVALAATLSPWIVRNAVRLGEPIATTTHGGYTLALANNPEYYRDVLNGPAGAVWSGPGQKAWFDRITRETSGMSEPRSDRYLRDQASDLIRERPLDFVRASIARVGRLWSIAPSDRVYPRAIRIASAAWTAPLWLALAWGLICPSSWRPPRAAAVAIILSITLIHIVYWTDLRMRAPMVPAIALMTVSGVKIAGRKKI